MAGRPKRRAKLALEAVNQQLQEQADAQEPDAYPIEPDAGPRRPRGASPERMRQITLARMEAAKTDPAKKGGRPRTKISHDEAEEMAMEKMLPRALLVLKKQLESPDEQIQQKAAVKVLEYVKGKPTQRIEQESKIAVVRYESAAWTFGQQGLPDGEVLELEPGPDDQG